MSKDFDEDLYEQIYDECHENMLDKLMTQYQALLADDSPHLLNSEECYLLIDWLIDRASKYAVDRAQEIYDEIEEENCE